MKKIYLILSVLAIVFTACETDFDVNSEWEETTVVFGLLDKAKEIQFVKINKAFLGEADALQMAQYSDSVNYVPFDWSNSTGDLQVRLYKINFNDTIAERILKDTLLLKDDGVFAADSNIIYYFNTPEGDNFLSKDRTYSLAIKNVKTGNSVSASTDIIKGFNFSAGIPSSNKIMFYSDALGYRFPRFEWSSINYPEAELFQFNLRFHYKENEIEKELSWTQTALGRNDNILILSGEDFFSFLKNNLVKGDFVREFSSIDIEMTLGSQDLKTYMAVNEPITGIVQERPQFTNINNGIGLFSSRYSYEYKGLDLHSGSEEYIIDELDLNFQ